MYTVCGGMRPHSAVHKQGRRKLWKSVWGLGSEPSSNPLTFEDFALLLTKSGGEGRIAPCNLASSPMALQLEDVFNELAIYQNPQS